MGLKNTYLFAYNAGNALAWGVLLYRVIAIASTEGFDAVGIQLDEYARLTQSVAAMEIIHSLIGLVPAPFFTTLTQVYSRLMLVWGVCFLFPELNQSPWYTSMLLAWSTAEVIRYGYFVFKLGTGSVPYPLHWLRYSAFSVLYPIGISSEVAMMIRAYMGPAEGLFWWYPWYIVAVLVGYPPAAVMLYTHMLSQRAKNLGGGKSKSSKKRQ